MEYADIVCYMSLLDRNWGEAGRKIVEMCYSAEKFNAPFSEFLNHCTACGGDWGGMLLSGVRDLYPGIYEVIPEKMGGEPFIMICGVLALLGVDLKK